MLYIIRHGRTDWNDAHRLQGRTDIPLNDNGRRMAREAGERYKDINFDVCFSSPQVRARETADLLLEGRDVPIIEDDRLREMSFGIYEGEADIFDNYEIPVRLVFKHPEQYTEAFEDAESFEDLYSRTGAFLREKVYPLLEEGKDVLIVGHGATNLSIINQINNIPIKDFWSVGIPNCQLMNVYTLEQI